MATKKLFALSVEPLIKHAVEIAQINGWDREDLREALEDHMRKLRVPEKLKR